MHIYYLLFIIIIVFLFLDEDGEKSVSVLLDGEEATMHFIDVSDDEVRFSFENLFNVRLRKSFSFTRYFSNDHTKFCFDHNTSLK